ncbi:MAG TPA: response regulator transcription factor [Candidatus Limnocylindrales bacterium]|jgi:DNA-binding NarL/FixJ family response regulator|nr:response regulator transcription factor [Candidatus Limnocylindrales bacterium]
MTERIRVLVADDHPIVRDGVRALIAASPGLELIGEAVDGDEAVTLVRRLHPDVVLMDLSMPGRNGIDATRAIVADGPATAVLILTMFADDESIFAAMRAGARGYLLKDAGHDEMRRAIEGVGHGEAIFGAGVAQRMVGFFARARELGVQPFPELTDREREVLEEIARGAGNAAIASRLGISVKTVRNHVSTVLGKLMVVDRAEAIVRAREAGFGVRHESPRGPTG